ncbi:hypothetical protein GCM10023166_26960 [Paeniglutamicibacter cryotolerans]|uniref:Uncharacterized protein n=1 Tax=Paeniglutamicibacter cryotolerans TaxID=670079 RepID=A0A839QLK2_9MICC|nr:hypothetical protein [Paeniglutamicibacter cryotolerans]
MGASIPGASPPIHGLDTVLGYLQAEDNHGIPQTEPNCGSRGEAANIMVDPTLPAVVSTAGSEISNLEKGIMPWHSSLLGP